MTKRHINKIPNCACFICNTPIYKEPYRLKKWNKFYCSQDCQYKGMITKKQVECTKCGKLFEKVQSQIKNSSNDFCSRSCSASYNNTNKSYGTRRSKLEIYLEQQIRENYPDLEVICNQKSVIQSELDFYFPELKFAIELNGIVHYEPIYGNEKFEKIQNNDKRKSIACYEKEIELAVIDTSSCGYLSEKNKLKFKNIVFDLLNTVKNRKPSIY